MTDSGKRPSFRVAILSLGEAAERIHLPARASRPGVAVTSAWRRFIKRLPKKLALVDWRPRRSPRLSWGFAHVFGSRRTGTDVTFYAFPKEHWKRLRTTNVMESPFAVVRLRTAAAE